MKEYTISTVGIARTPFKQKFGIPRQSRLVDVPGRIELDHEFSREEAIEGLQQVSHIWVLFLFDRHKDDKSRLTVRPPRLGGNKKVGVFATRSSYRPNRIGQSLLKLEKVDCRQGAVTLYVSGVDMLDGTPIIDIKPYLPYADYAADAMNNIAPDMPPQDCNVEWEAEADHQLIMARPQDYQEIRMLLGELIALDPRPAYRADEIEECFGMCFYNLNIRWRVVSVNMALVTSVEIIDDANLQTFCP